ncbi:MAG: CHASE2 domain-containing protein, partial [Pseudomonadota bacterium]
MGAFPAEKLRLAVGFALAFAAALAVFEFESVQPLQQSLLDQEYALLREIRTQPARNEVVVVGIDEASLSAFAEPFALWHPHLGRFLIAMSAARPSALGIDIVLPSNSYHSLIPQYDQSLLAGLAAVRGKVPLVLAQTVDEQGNFRKIFPPFISMAGSDPLGSVVMCPDPDRVVRRYGEGLCDDSGKLGLFASKMAKHLGLEQRWQGWIDYTLGEAITYVPFIDVLQWAESDPDKLKST